MGIFIFSIICLSVRWLYVTAASCWTWFLILKTFASRKLINTHKKNVKKKIIPAFNQIVPVCSAAGSGIQKHMLLHRGASNPHKHVKFKYMHQIKPFLPGYI